MADRDLYDLAEACRRLSISDKYARNLIKAGTLAAVRQGRARGRAASGRLGRARQRRRAGQGAALP